MTAMEWSVKHSDNWKPVMSSSISMGDMTTTLDPSTSMPNDKTMEAQGFDWMLRPLVQFS